MTGTGSLPLYSPLRLDPTGRHHLLLLDASAEAPADIHGAKCWRIGTDHATATDMGGELEHALADAPAGLRLYLKGSEAFLWQLGAIAFDAGLLPGEVQMEKGGPVARPVICIACRALSILVEECPESFDCACGLRLKVRMHFSQRLGAYQGVPC